jgi:hypothetical protein
VTLLKLKNSFKTPSVSFEREGKKMKGMSVLVISLYEATTRENVIIDVWKNIESAPRRKTNKNYKTTD